MKWKVAAGALLGGSIGVGVTALHALGELATDPTAPGGRLAGMEKNFPGNDMYVAVDVFGSAIPFIVIAALAGALAATVLSRLLKNRRPLS
jgi:hypothetical protein